MEKRQREISPEQAFGRMAKYCSLAERATADVTRLLTGYGVGAEDRDDIIERLTTMGFLSDSRYARAFVRSKTAQGWGSYKIRQGLKVKKIEPSLFEPLISEIDQDTTRERLLELLAKKGRNTKYSSSYELKTKLFRFAMGRGFSYDEIEAVIDNAVDEIVQE